jgi:DNA-binding MarR family transcriptional regulator
MYHDEEDDKPEIGTVRIGASDVDAIRKLLRKLLDQLSILNKDTTEIDNSIVAERDAAHLPELARGILHSRRRRSLMFNPSMFGEPAWDMLLILYASMTDGSRLSVGRLSSLAGAPPTTALRWLDYLEMERLVVRESNPDDRRSDFVDLTDKGRSVMEQYLSETSESGR